jgi:hypothetical protein
MHTYTYIPKIPPKIDTMGHKTNFLHIYVHTYIHACIPTMPPKIDTMGHKTARAVRANFLAKSSSTSASRPVRFLTSCTICVYLQKCACIYVCVDTCMFHLCMCRYIYVCVWISWPNLHQPQRRRRCASSPRAPSVRVCVNVYKSVYVCVDTCMHVYGCPGQIIINLSVEACALLDLMHHLCVCTDMCIHICRRGI